MDARFTLTEYVVEATSTEQYYLWKDASPNCKWEQGMSGLAIEVGKLGGPLQEKRPIVITCQWNRINGMDVLFWEATSRLVDYRMIEEWFKQNCYPYEHSSGKAAKCDAMNFHSCIRYSKEERPTSVRDGLVTIPSFYYRPPSKP
jgi:hypothetical protein